MTKGFVAALAAAVVSQLGVAGALAAEPNQVTGLGAEQRHGFTRLAWTPVADASDYQIERTPVDASNAPTGAPAVVGVWQPQRTVTPQSPTFADAGYALGQRFEWRVRARFGATPQPYSERAFYDEGKLEMVEGWMYGHAAVDGWWMGPYSTGGDSHEGILGNTGGLKNTISMLGEARGAGGVTRPAEGTNLANRNRKVYAHLWENWQGLEYYDARLPIIHNLVQASIAYNSSNTGPVVLRGSYPWPYNPLNGANTGLPDVDAVTPDHILDPPPCGYFLTPEQYSGPNPDGTVEERLRLHGIAVEKQPNGYLVRMAQPQRGLIAPLLDPAAVAPEPMVAAERRYDCPAVTSGDVGGTVPATLSLTVGGAAFGAFTPGVARATPKAPLACA